MLIGRRSLWLGLLSSFAITMSATRSDAASAGEIDVGVDATLDRFFSEVAGAYELAAKAAAILVFPSVIKAGLGIGGEYGEGALRIRGRTVDYYNTATASVGFQFGAQARSIVILFLTRDALASFRRIDGWKVGVDGSVALITVSAGGSIDSNLFPVVGFVLGAKGLMYNLTLEGSKISRIKR